MTLIEQAGRICRQKGERFTPIRQKVFTLLEASDGARTAYELLDELAKDMPNARPPTIYRALEFLQQMGFVHRLDSRNAFVLCTHFEDHHAAQFLVCDQCGSVAEIHMPAAMQGFRNEAVKLGFDVHSETVELHGLCKDCH